MSKLQIIAELLFCPFLLNLWSLNFFIFLFLSLSFRRTPSILPIHYICITSSLYFLYFLSFTTRHAAAVKFFLYVAMFLKIKTKFVIYFINVFCNFMTTWIYIIFMLIAASSGLKWNLLCLFIIPSFIDFASSD